MTMKIIKNGNSTDFQIKKGDTYVTVASLVPWFLCKHFNKYDLYFYYYGDEFYQGHTPNKHFNGNVSFTVWREKYEHPDDFIKRVSKIVAKKLYAIASSILEEIRYMEQ